MSRRPNLTLRPVPGGYVQRCWLGDRYAWHSFDGTGNRLPFTAPTFAAAVAKVPAPAADYWADYARTLAEAKR